MSEIPNTNLSFKLKPAIKLKQSIESLRDSSFNPEGFGLVEVTASKFKITVRNVETRAVGYLSFNSSGLIDFHYCINKPFDCKMINLNQISKILLDVSDDDSVTIFHLDGSTNLSFNLGSDPIREVNVELLHMNPEFEKIPEVTFFCEAVILSDALREMIGHLETNGKDKLVSVDMSERLVSVFIGERPWLYKYEGQIVGTRGMTPGQKHHAWFGLPHLELLKKASSVAPGFLICFVTEPKDSVMMRFNLRELGDLAFINKTTMIIPNSDQIPVGGGNSDEF